MKLSVLVLLLPTVLSLRLPVALGRRDAMCVASVIGVFGLAPPTPAIAAELYTSYGKKELASYDILLLENQAKEIATMLEGTTGDKRDGLQECARLIQLILVLDWPSLDKAAKARDPAESTTQKLCAGIKKQDPKVVSRVVLEIAEDLDVANYVSAPNQQLIGLPKTPGT